MSGVISGYYENIIEAPLDATVCWCSNISKRDIIEAIKNGAETIDSIRSITGACTIGKCKEMSPRGRCCSKEIKLLFDAEKNVKGN